MFIFYNWSLADFLKKIYFLNCPKVGFWSFFVAVWNTELKVIYNMTPFIWQGGKPEGGAINLVNTQGVLGDVLKIKKYKLIRDK